VDIVMREVDIEVWLAGTLLDFKLSHSEALELRELLPQLKNDEISFARNKAFLLARDQVVLGGDNAVATLIWLEKIVKNIDNFRVSDAPIVNSAHFSPGDDCRRKLLDLCVNARRTLDISVFTISENRLSDVIIAAHKRGVVVRVITDNDKSLDEGSDIEALMREGINVRMDDTPYHMHHKFALIDGHTLINGSFNWTRSASDYNHENILVTNEPVLVAAYLKEFEDLWKKFNR
jgi:phosphatidylserine/phosphatidylglycerophosphate/cardiolipin synthase-like enzyme